MSNSIISSRQVAELNHAFERNGVTSYYVKKMSEGDFFAQALQLLLGDAELKTVERVIDCDVDPIIPEGSTLVRHTRGGIVKWKDFEIELVRGFDYERDDRRFDDEHFLPRYLIDKPVLNANIQQYLMRYSHLLPKDFSFSVLISPIVFWGTIYKNKSGILWVPGMSSNGNKLYEYSLRVDEDVDYDHSVALKVI